MTFVHDCSSEGIFQQTENSAVKWLLFVILALKAYCSSLTIQVKDDICSWLQLWMHITAHWKFSCKVTFVHDCSSDSTLQLPSINRYGTFKFLPFQNKKHLQGLKCFHDINEAVTDVKKWFSSKLAYFYEDGINPIWKSVFFFFQISRLLWRWY